MASLLKQVHALSQESYAKTFGIPPTQWVLTQTERFLRALGKVLTPARIVPMADGGIGVVLPKVQSRSARVNITNEHEVVLTLDHEKGTEYHELSLDETVPQVIKFFGL